ncbi:hypothetical protein BXZ70DRAFT_930649 [Cristinia sonorae]|uniref:Uncharacterized protein n=1 Tax=Cristinia sonorae TaxID=1940300 RepID=A0A8K0USE8_9AGAR|nr:hypothetical protein BXZ70DRAFT_930649 [Cristinia sonorae]
MDERRAKTLDALSTFIQAQRTLLSQTETDIRRLKELRGEIAEQSSDINVPYYLDEIRNSTSKLSEQADITATLPADFDWSLLALQDPTPFKQLASTSKQANEKQGPPKSESQTESSALLQMVRDRRRTIIDPVLASIPPLSSEEEDEPLDPEELKKIREREKIRELKLRKINGGGASALGTRKPRASEGVFIRTDVEDESAEVDIWGVEPHSKAVPRELKSEDISSSEVGHGMDVDTPPTSVTSPKSTKSSVPPAQEPNVPGSARQRRSSRPSTSAAPPVKSARAKGKQAARGANPAPPPATEGMDVEEDPSTALEAPLDKRGKPRPETYKQAWSVSEQHLLERLMEEIPEGEKNRWAKISKAMNGRRTPRQVASRVQKYYEKLKRFGLEMGKS